MKRVRLVSNRFYLLPSNALVKILAINNYNNNIIIYNFSSKQNEVMEASLAEKILIPVFKLSEVAAALGKKTDTIRRYERDGKIPKARQVQLGQRGSMRVYTRDEVEDLADFFGERIVGRPAKNGVTKTSISQQKINQMYDKIIKEI